MKKVVYAKGEVVFREGDVGSCFYQIEEGTAGVYLHYGEAEQRKLTDMNPGQYFGEMAVIETYPRSTTIAAESELHVIEIAEGDLNAYFTEQPDKIYALMRQLGDRIRSLTAEYDEVEDFIRGKSEAGAEKQEGFIAKLKKYLELSALAKKNAGATQEEVIAQSMPAQGARFGLKIDSSPLVIDRILSDGDVIHFAGEEIQVLETPGHSPGSLSFYCPDTAVIFTGDAVFQSSIGRTDLPGGSYTVLIDSINTKIMTLPADTVIAPGHGDTTTVGDEKVYNPYLA